MEIFEGADDFDDEISRLRNLDYGIGLFVLSVSQFGEGYKVVLTDKVNQKENGVPVERRRLIPIPKNGKIRIMGQLVELEDFAYENGKKVFKYGGFKVHVQGDFIYRVEIIVPKRSFFTEFSVY